MPGWDGADGVALSVFLASFAVLGIWTAMRRSRDLVAAKEENALLMIGQERARLARDLHDILGHSLTVIAVKAELADRLVDVSPERARAEIADIQRLSRDALRDVRLTVDGVRELTLPGELSRARAALAAAQIQAELPGSTDDVPSELRGLFAWTLREGVTNVIRHSAARHVRGHARARPHHHRRRRTGDARRRRCRPAGRARAVRPQGARGLPPGRRWWSRPRSPAGFRLSVVVARPARADDPPAVRSSGSCRFDLVQPRPGPARLVRPARLRSHRPDYPSWEPVAPPVR